MNELPFVAHGTTLAFAWFLLMNVTLSAGVALVSAALTRQTRALSPGFWLALRLLPAALSILFVAAVFLPSYWRYEPRDGVEGFDVTLTTLAALAISVIAAGTVRAVSAWRRAARRTDAWMQMALPMRLAESPVATFAINADVPVMALVGVLRPRLLITRPVLEVLTEEELRAGVAHEIGHQRAWDNLKRLLMQAAPDLLFATPAARALERRWASASEHVADRRAGDSAARCALASALVKVARMTPPLSAIAEPISSLVDGGDIASRVTRLLDDAPWDRRGRATRWLLLGAAVAAVTVNYTPILHAVHGVTEILVNSLP